MFFFVLLLLSVSRATFYGSQSKPRAWRHSFAMYMAIWMTPRTAYAARRRLGIVSSSVGGPASWKRIGEMTAPCGIPLGMVWK